MNNISKNILLTAVVLLISFITLEIILHTIFPLRTTNPSNTTYELTHPEYNMTITTNSFGLRDRDYTKQIPDGTYRILVIGDSFTFGVGAQNNETYSKVLERELNKKSKVEVLNAGKSGTGPKEYLDLLNHYSPIYDYDMVLVGLYVGNDIIDSNDPYLNEGFISLVKKSRIITMTFNLITSVYQKKKKSKISNILIFNAKRAPQFYVDSLLLESPAIKASAEQAMRYLLEMNRVVGDKKMVVMLIPQAMQVDHKYHSFFHDTGFIVKEEFLTNPKAQSTITSFLKNHNIHYIDLLPNFKEHANEDLYFWTDDHVNSRGQQFIGTVLSKNPIFPAAGIDQSVN